MTDDASPLDRCRAELGPPDAVFSVDPAQARGRLVLGLCLLVGGVAGNYLFWFHGPAKFGAVLAKLLLAPPVLGVILLWHLYRNRGLHVLAYPTGLLRLQGDAVESYPWADVADVRVKAASAKLKTERDAAGRLTAAWLDGDVPTVQIWNAAVTVRRADETEARFTPVLVGYADLAELVQAETFRARWPKAWAAHRAGESQAFGPLTATPDGLTFGKKSLPWADVAEVVIENKGLVVKRKGGWGTWATCSLDQVPHPHVFLALVEEIRAARKQPVTDADAAG